ncbi:MAG: hypothetical protein AAFY26_20145 [Cyanobacteria bacterium J06638_22]
MPQATFEIRKELTEAIELFGDGHTDAALEKFSVASSIRPGSKPIGTQDPATLARMCEAMPQNLTARLALADTLSVDEAQPKYVSIVRQLRALKGFERAPEAGQIDVPSLNNLHWHSIDLGREWIEGLRKTAKVLAHEMLMAEWPDLTGKSVLDIGAFGGWFSFEAERRGASQVTAMEYYSWVLDFPKVRKWVSERLASGQIANAYDPPDDCFDFENQPGRLAFDLTRKALNSDVTPWLAKFEDVELPPHDVTLLLGVLYHNENPYQMLEQVAGATRERLIIETHAASCPHALTDPTWHFFGAGEVRGDGSTFWAPSEQGLVDMLKRVGFQRIEVLYGWDLVAPLPQKSSVQHRMWVHAHK